MTKIYLVANAKSPLFSILSLGKYNGKIVVFIFPNEALRQSSVELAIQHLVALATNDGSETKK
ncbi:hypothetical protein [Lactococcus petauri]|uniref:hypothetical protein n=1 Tax=Lactococcus petauri TaxID=1940789 RepID=UPI00117A74B4|nr:hypothetical protein [Lactococcus petauri]